MAPNRKKRVTANPARGFATTSVASKSKVQEDQTSQASPGREIKAPSPEESVITTETTRFNAEQKTKDIHPDDLGPEEYEEHLENSRIALLLDNNLEKVLRDVKRHVAKLKTERRRLQSSSDHVDFGYWMPPEVKASAEGFATSLTPISRQSQTHPQESLNDDEILVRIWTLKRTMTDLDFRDDYISDALKHILKSPSILSSSHQSHSRSTQGIWGLDESLVYLASRSPFSESLKERVVTLGKGKSDESPRLPPLENSTEIASRESCNGDQEQPTDPQFGRETANSATSPEMSVRQSRGESTPDTSSSDDEQRSPSSDSSSDDDPGTMAPKYSRLLLRLHMFDPKLADMKYGNLIQKSARKPQPLDTYPSPISRVLNRMARFDTDILFDKHEAAMQWITLRNAHAKELAERKRFRLKQEPAVRNTESNSPGDRQHASGTPSGVADDPLDNLGEFLFELPEQNPDTNDKQSDKVVSDGVNLQVRDIGKLSGTRPRRILEETCKLRDKAVKLRFELISKSALAYRHACSIDFSELQSTLNSLSVEGVNIKGSPRSLQLEMVHLAMTDPAQSEGYLATLALFCLCSQDPRDEKIHLRLSSIWRDEWLEFGQLAQEQRNGTEIEALRSLQGMIREHQEQPTIDGVSTSPTVDKPVNQSNPMNISTVHSEEPPRSRTLSNQLHKDVWEACSSKPAFKSMGKGRKALPIHAHKAQLLHAIEENQVVIICGETGCGKSTQVPSYILENELQQGHQCKIYCTQPRRISAISLARRVSEELGDRKGDVGTNNSLVGYAIRLESRMTAQTKLVYATTGIVMRMLESSFDLGDITHLVIDEVHERSIDSDFLLIILRKLVTLRPELRVILMSATVNASKFSDYLSGAPVLNVPGRTYPVSVRYLEDAIEATGFGTSEASGSQDDSGDSDAPATDLLGTSKQGLMESIAGYKQKTKDALLHLNEFGLPFALIIKLIRAIASKPEYANFSKAILVFLPGIAEIRRVHDLIKSDPFFSHSWVVHSLHSSIATGDQERAFLIPPPGTRKIVLSTNIAETGVTIPDITCVIDGGKHKEMRFDEKRQLSRLIEFYISRANAKQRRGRAGRVQNGLCFHLFTKYRHDSLLAEEQTPEILRLSLQDLVLRVKICKLGGIEETLAEALDPPVPKNVRRAIDALIDVKALTSGEDLTPLGRRLASLPLDVFLGKLVLLGAIFGCLDGCLTIAAILSSKTPFVTSMHNRQQADIAKQNFKKGDSDLITLYNVMLAYRRMSSEPKHVLLHWSQKNFLSLQTLSSIEDLRAQICTSLMDAGFLGGAKSYSRQVQDQLIAKYDWNAGNDLILNTVIAWSFYPKLLRREGGMWCNVANNKLISIDRSSVNKVKPTAKWLSFYSIMQSARHSQNAQETSPVDDVALALFCGDADFRMYSSVMVIDGSRMKFKFEDWQVLRMVRMLRMQLKGIAEDAFRKPGREMSEMQRTWFGIWEKMFWHVHQGRELRKGAAGKV